MERARTEIRITEVAAKAIIDQAEYYAAQQDNALAIRWDKAVARAIESLLKMPERGSRCHFQSAQLNNVRRIPVPGFPRHLIFYQYIREPRAIRIIHVLHGARDIEAIIAGLGS